MTIEFLPVGIKCNLKCTYCYQEPMREAGNFSAPLNLIAVKDQLLRAGSDFALFGGEPLLAPISQLEDLWGMGFARYGKNGVQTNGLLITPQHVELFKLYNVQVGVSIDGPARLNAARSTELETAQIIENIKSMLVLGVQLSIITTIHALNAWDILTLLDFFEELEGYGLRHVNLHNLEVDSQATDQSLRLSDEANFLAFKSIYEDSKRSNLQYKPFTDIVSLLTDDKPSVSCIWSGCDPLTTPAVQGINPSGDLTNCGRTNKEGIDWLKSQGGTTFERYQALALTPWDDGGCKDCKYFFACKGQCPGTAIDGDWRNRTKDCRFWYTLLTYIHRDLTKRGVKTVDTEQANQRFLNNITRPGDQSHGDTPHGDTHGDHTDAPRHRTESGARVHPN